MSSGQKPRTREFFPRMKDRAAGRHARRLMRSTGEIGRAFAALGEAFSQVGVLAQSFAPFTAALERMIEMERAQRAFESWDRAPLMPEGTIVDPMDSQRAILPSGDMATKVFIQPLGADPSGPKEFIGFSDLKLGGKRD